MAGWCCGSCSTSSRSAGRSSHAVFEHGLAYARSAAFYDTTLFWQWMRLPGDVVFAAGALLMAWDFIVKLRPLFPRAFARLAPGGDARISRRAAAIDEHCRRARVGWRGPGVSDAGFPAILHGGFGLVGGRSGPVARHAGGTRDLPIRFDPLSWHIHEMMFGFAMAAVAGFLLTAIPNWTGRPPISGSALGMLAGLWLIGRVACLVSALLPAFVASVADLSFSAVLIAVVAHEVVGGRNWRNLPMVAPLTVLGLGNLMMHLEANGVAVSAGLGWRLALAALIILISVVGGRVVPSFTRNWLVKRGAAKLPGAHGPVDTIALFALHTGLLAWALLPNFPRSGCC